MSVAIIKYFSIIACSLYLYKKILNVKTTHWMIWCSLLYSAISAVAMWFGRQYIPTLSIGFLLFLTALFVTAITKIKFDLSVTATVISFGMSFAFYSLGSIIVSLPFSVLAVDTKNNIPFILIIAVIQYFLCFIPFRIQRLKNGFTFLNKHGAGSLGVFISSVVLCCIVLVSQTQSPDYFKLIPVVGVVICTASFFFWWRSSITKTYLERQKQKKLDEALIVIKEKEQYIQKLTANNKALADVMHKDNKGIPATILSIQNFIDDSLKTGSADTNLGAEIISTLEKSYAERKNVLTKYKASGKTLPLTNILSIDSILSYMLVRATEADVDFDVRITANVSYMIHNIISEDALKTLLADLIENAIIAVATCDNKKILVTIGLVDDCYEISVDDSGIPFDPEVLRNLGTKQITTHAGEGGSGIGMMTTFEILREFDASITVSENITDLYPSTKRVMIRFDRKRMYICDVICFSMCHEIQSQR